MMQLSSSFLLGQCAILLVSFEGIVCPVLMDFAVNNFSTVNMYSHVHVEGSNRTGRLILKKSKRVTDSADSFQQHVVKIPDILHSTMKQEGNCRKIVSFSVSGASDDYSIKFHSEEQAHVFTNYKALPSHFKILWARIYSHSGQVIIAYDKFDSGDVGFKLLDNEDWTDEYARLEQLPYVLTRSDVKKEIRIGDQNTLYLSSKTRRVDYAIKFRSRNNLDTFLELFPEKKYDERKTSGYYIIPFAEESRDTSTSHAPPESHDTSE